MRKLSFAIGVTIGLLLGHGVYAQWIKPAARPGLKVEKSLAADTTYTGTVHVYEPSIFEANRSSTALTVQQSGAGFVVEFKNGSSAVLQVSDDGTVYITGSLDLNGYAIGSGDSIATRAYARANGGGGGAGTDVQARAGIDSLRAAAIHTRLTNKHLAVFLRDSLLDVILSNFFTFDSVSKTLSLDTTKIATVSLLPNQTWSGYPSGTPLMNRVTRVYVDQQNGLQMSTGGTGVVSISLPTTANLVVNTITATNIPTLAGNSDWTGDNLFENGISIGKSAETYTAKIKFLPTSIDENQFAVLTVDGDIYEQADTLLLPHLPLGVTIARLLSMADTSAAWFFTQSEGNAKQALHANLTTLSSPGNWKIFYTNSSGTVNALSIGTAGQFLKSTGTTSAPIFASVTATAGGSSTQVQFNDVGTIEGSSNFTYTDDPPVLTIGDIIVGTAGRFVIVNGVDVTTTIAATASVGNTSFNLPPTNGTNLYHLITDGDGNTSWKAPDTVGNAAALATKLGKADTTGNGYIPRHQMASRVVYVARMTGTVEDIPDLIGVVNYTGTTVTFTYVSTGTFLVEFGAAVVPTANNLKIYFSDASGIANGNFYHVTSYSHSTTSFRFKVTGIRDDLSSASLSDFVNDSIDMKIEVDN